MVQTATVVVTGLAATFFLAVWSSFHRVPEGDVEILLVFGRARQILEPGPYFVPPFVSATYPIDLRTMQYETPHGRRSIPPEVRDEAERIATDREQAEAVRE